MMIRTRRLIEIYCYFQYNRHKCSCRIDRHVLMHFPSKTLWSSRASKNAQVLDSTETSSDQSRNPENIPNGVLSYFLPVNEAFEWWLGCRSLRQWEHHIGAHHRLDYREKFRWQFLAWFVSIPKEDSGCQKKHSDGPGRRAMVHTVHCLKTLYSRVRNCARPCSSGLLCRWASTWPSTGTSSGLNRLMYRRPVSNLLHLHHPPQPGRQISERVFSVSELPSAALTFHPSSQLPDLFSWACFPVLQLWPLILSTHKILQRRVIRLVYRSSSTTNGWRATVIPRFLDTWWCISNYNRRGRIRGNGKIVELFDGETWDCDDD